MEDPRPAHAPQPDLRRCSRNGEDSSGSNDDPAADNITRVRAKSCRIMSRGNMSKSRTEIWLSLGVLALGMIPVAIAGLWGYMSTTATPLHPNPRDRCVGGCTNARGRSRWDVAGRDGGDSDDLPRARDRRVRDVEHLLRRHVCCCVENRAGLRGTGEESSTFNPGRTLRQLEVHGVARRQTRAGCATPYLSPCGRLEAM